MPFCFSMLPFCFPLVCFTHNPPCLRQQTQKLSLKLEAMPGICFTTSESAPPPIISPCSWLRGTKPALGLINFPLSFKNIYIVLCFLQPFVADRNGQTLTFLFVLWTVSAEGMQWAVIISPGGGYSVLTILKAWLRKCPALYRLLRNEN